MITGSPPASVPGTMLLRSSRFSPFVRKVRVCADELGLTGRIELAECNPHEDESLREVNPLCKVPTLIVEGVALFDSRVICRVLADIAGNATLVPPPGRDSWPVLRDEALGDGICDAAVALRGEKIRPREAQYARFMARQITAIRAACDMLEPRCDTLEQRLDVGVVAIACALGYLDLRHPELGWRDAHPQLAAWHARFEERASMHLTRCPPPSTP